MTARVFVDSNVMVYASDPTDLAKMHQAAAWLTSLWRQGSGAVSPQILNEYYSVVTQKLSPGLDFRIARRDVRRYLRWQLVRPDRQMYDIAFQIQDRFGFSWWDCLIVAAAKRGGSTHLLTEDLQHGQDLGSLIVVDPFQALPASILGA